MGSIWPHGPRTCRTLQRKRSRSCLRPRLRSRITLYPGHSPLCPLGTLVRSNACTAKTGINKTRLVSFQSGLWRFFQGVGFSQFFCFFFPLVKKRGVFWGVFFFPTLLWGFTMGSRFCGNTILCQPRKALPL